MRPALEASEERQPLEVDIIHSANLEHVVRTDRDALGLTFASIPIDHRDERGRRRSASLTWAMRVPRRGARLRCVEGRALAAVRREIRVVSRFTRARQNPQPSDVALLAPVPFAPKVPDDICGDASNVGVDVAQ
jgi:hypothetical protein